MRHATRTRTRIPGAVDNMPSGVNPGLYSNLQLWFDAMTIKNLADGAAISQWNDLSGNGRNLSQATGGNQPIYKTKGLNGLPCVRTNGSSAYMDCNAFSFTNITMFVVHFNSNWVDGDKGICSFFATGQADWNHADAFLFAVDSADYKLQIMRYYGSANMLDAKLTMTIFNPIVTTIRLVNTGSAGTGYIHVNGGADASDTYSDLSSIDPNTMRLGARGSGIEGYGRNDYSEIICYSDLKDAATISAIEAHLMAKWRIG